MLDRDISGRKGLVAYGENLLRSVDFRLFADVTSLFVLGKVIVYFEGKGMRAHAATSSAATATARHFDLSELFCFPPLAMSRAMVPVLCYRKICLRKNREILQATQCIVWSNKALTNESAGTFLVVGT